VTDTANITSLLLGITQSGIQLTEARTVKQAAGVEAKRLELDSIRSEADRKERLVTALASQSARVGASGISFEGSPLTVLESAIKKEERATERAKFDTQMNKMRTKQKARGQVSGLRAGASLSLLSDVAKFAEAKEKPKGE